MTDKDDASERITSYIDGIGDWRGQVLARIRSAFLEADPEMLEEWKWMGSPVWSRHGQIAVANAHKGKVKLTFSNGAHLEDEHGLFNAGLGGKKWRAIDITEGDPLDEAQLKDLVRAAIRYNQAKRGA